MENLGSAAKVVLHSARSGGTAVSPIIASENLPAVLDRATDIDLPDRVVGFWTGTGDDRGEPELRRELTASERGALERRAGALRNAVAPAPEQSRDALMREISRMLGGFPQMQGHDFKTAQVIAVSYLFTVRSAPHWAIVKACEQIRTGVAGLNPNFCPPEPAFATVVARCTEQYWRMLRGAEAVLRARVMLPPAAKMTREEIEAKLGRPIGVPPEAPPRAADPSYAARVAADLRARRERNAAAASPSPAQGEGG